MGAVLCLSGVQPGTALAGLLLWMGQLVDGHLHVAPHGGTIAHAGRYHLEFRIDERAVDVWIFDARMRPLAPGARWLRMVATRRQGTTQTIVLAPAGDHLHGVADFVGLPDVLVRLELRSGRRFARAVFKWTQLDRTDRIQDGDPLDGLKL